MHGIFGALIHAYLRNFAHCFRLNVSWIVETSIENGLNDMSGCRKL